MSGGLYLGREVDPAGGGLGARIELDPSDLLTHGLIVGMTGSGKTGLAVALIEEVLRQGVPVLAIDPKGDLGNLLLLFDDLGEAAFAPWIDAEAARREGRGVAEAAREASAAWTRGLGEWGLGAADVAALRRAHDAIVFTPGSEAGVSLNVLQSLDAPGVPFESAEEDLRDEIAGIVAGILGLVGIDADPLRSRESILLATLIETSWRSGRSLGLDGLVAGIADPPFDRLGALGLESAYPRRERQELMLAVNNLLAAPAFAVWRQGRPLDIPKLLRAPDGRPRLAVVSTAHLSDRERLFVTALVLDRFKTWTRRQPGTGTLGALLYMDEVFGYFPPHPANPPSKRPLLSLLKQARAHGVGVVLATQNPVDLDYKGLANMGVWLVGTLQTEQDRRRLREGLLGAAADAAAVDRLLAATRKRVFLLHDVHRSGPCLLHSRWALSYLRGPMTRDQISKLMRERVDDGHPATRPVGGETPSGAPVLPAPLRHHYLDRHGGRQAVPHLLVKYAVRYSDSDEAVAARAYPLSGAGPAELVEAEPIEVDEAAVTQAAPPALRYADLPGWLTAPGVKAVQEVLGRRLPDKLAVTVLVDPVTKSESVPSETAELFAARLRAASPGPPARKLQARIDKKRRELAAREQDLAGRKAEKWASLGGAVLSGVLGFLKGRRRSVRGVGSVLSKNRMENTAEARVEALRAELAELEQERAGLGQLDPARLRAETRVPSRADVKLLRWDLVWVH